MSFNLKGFLSPGLFLLVLAVWQCLLTPSVFAASVTFYVATNGNDQWSGRLAAPNSDHTDGPLATLDQARKMVQSVDRSSVSEISVQFRNGIYYLPATVDFIQADSGTPNTPVVYENYPGEQPIFTGGVRVQNWTHVSGNKWTANLPPSTVIFENLFYDGQRRLRPRLGGYLGQYLHIAGPVKVSPKDLPNTPLPQNCPITTPDGDFECFDRFYYSPTDLSGGWLNLAAAAVNPCGSPAGNSNLLGDIEMLNFEQFSTSKLRISCIDTAKQIVYLTGTTTYSQANYSQDGFQSGRRYLVENVEDAFTEPGQWFLDHSRQSAWTLSYLAYPGENPNLADVVIPQTAPPLIRTFDLKYVTFRGLAFENDNYTVPASGHPSRELEADIAPIFSVQDSQYITVESTTFRQISGTGLEILSCLPGDPSSNLPPILKAPPAWCASIPADPSTVTTTHNAVKNSIFYDIGALGIRIGDPWVPKETQENIPQFTAVENNVVEGYGRIIPSSFGVGQGMGHDNSYTHNDVYDGYHCAISISEQTTVQPDGLGNFNNTISFNHVYNLMQGIMSDGGSIRIESGNGVFTSPGNKIRNNRIHDVSDASAHFDQGFGYGGNGVYLDNSTGEVDVENNLIYRVSDTAVYTPHGPAPILVGKKVEYNGAEPNVIKNNILAFARKALIGVNFPYADFPNTDNELVPDLVFTVSNNIFFFDRSAASPGTPFHVIGQCTYTSGQPFNTFEVFSSNLYWRMDGTFRTDPDAFFLQTTPDSTSQDEPCGDPNLEPGFWTSYSFSQWKQAPFNEDTGSIVQNPHFAFPFFPIDDYSLVFGSPGAGFVPFDPNEAGRMFPAFIPPPVAPTFLTAPYDPWTDF